jgi:hypothetical protein
MYLYIHIRKYKKNNLLWVQPKKCIYGVPNLYIYINWYTNQNVSILSSITESKQYSHLPVYLNGEMRYLRP